MSSAESTYKSKAVKLSQRLLRDIFHGDFIPGTRLPTQEDLARKYGASRPTVRRALNMLSQDHPLVKELQDGAVLPRQDDDGDIHHPVATVLFFGGEDHLSPGRYANELFGYMSSQITHRGMAMRVQLMKPEADQAKIIKELARRNPAVVVTFSVDLPHFSLVQFLNRRGIPCLHLFPNLAETISPCLTFQDEAIIRRRVEHLVELGHRRIVYLHDVDAGKPPVWTHQNQLDIFYRLCMEYKLDVQPGWVRYSGGSADSVRQQVRDIMTKPEPRPTAFLINDEHVNPTYAALRECGYVPGRDVSVVGTDDRAWAKHVDPPLTTIRLPRARSADMACEMIGEIAAGRNPGVRYLDTELVVRKSTVPAK